MSDNRIMQGSNNKTGRLPNIPSQYQCQSHNRIQVAQQKDNRQVIYNSPINIGLFLYI